MRTNDIKSATLGLTRPHTMQRSTYVFWVVQSWDPYSAGTPPGPATSPR